MPQVLNYDVVMGTHSVTAAQASANIAAIATGLERIGSLIVQVTRAGADVTVDAVIKKNLDAAAAGKAGTFTVADGGATYNMAEGDLIEWIASPKP